MSSSPLEQFKISDIIPIHIGQYDLSFTNASLFMFFAYAIIGSFFYFTAKRLETIPGGIQSSAEVMYNFVLRILNENTAGKGEQYFPFIFSLFLFIITLNVLGLIPHGFAVTSQIVVTFALAITVFIIVTIIAFIRHGFHFFSFFLPSGTPWFLAPLMIIIEFFTYCTRPVSLSMRLAANMMSGHILIAVVAGFIMMMGIAGVLPISFIVVFTGFEFFVAVLQAYIFTILTCVYLNDAINLH